MAGNTEQLKKRVTLRLIRIQRPNHELIRPVKRLTRRFRSLIYGGGTLYSRLRGGGWQARGNGG
jgi:hypothetical protein